MLGLRLAGEATHQTKLGDVAVEVTPAVPGRVDIYIPLADWGVRARAIDAPLEMAAEPRTLDRQALISAADGNREVVRQASDDLRDAANDALFRALAFALTGALAAALVAMLLLRSVLRLTPRQARALAATGFIVALAVSVGTLVATRATFDAKEFNDPELYARGAELMQLLQVAEKGQQAAAEYESSVERSVGGLAGLLSAAARLSEAPDTASVVLASDLHGNALVLGPLRRLFAETPIVFAGDFGHTGSEEEADALVPRIARLGSPVLAVSGNHDSSLFMRRLAAAGVLVLTERGRLGRDGAPDGDAVIDVAGFKFAGLSDPLEWRRERPDNPGRIFSFSERADGEREYADAEQRTIDWFDDLPERPDVVVIHQNGLAQALARHLGEQPDPRPVVVLTGHDHEQHLDRYRGGVVVVDAGTVGAGGLLAAGHEYVGLAEVHFRDSPRRLRSVDLIGFDPLSGSAEAARAIVEDDTACERDTVNCHDLEEE
jgi:predicted phosphodiesterase